MSLYIRLVTEALTDAKFLAVGPEAAWCYVRGLLYSKQHMTDGFVPQHALGLVTLGATRSPQGIVDDLVRVGLWEESEDGWTVGSGRWARHQVTRDQVETKRKADAERKRQWRERRAAKRHGPVTDMSQRDNGVRHAPVTTESLLQTTDHRPQTTEYRPQTTYISGRVGGGSDAPAHPDKDTKSKSRDSANPPGDIDADDWRHACEVASLIEATGDSADPAGEARALALYYWVESRPERDTAQTWARLKAVIPAAAGSDVQKQRDAVANLRKYPDGALPSTDGRASRLEYLCRVVRGKAA